MKVDILQLELLSKDIFIGKSFCSPPFSFTEVFGFKLKSCFKPVNHWSFNPSWPKTNPGNFCVFVSRNLSVKINVKKASNTNKIKTSFEMIHIYTTWNNFSILLTVLSTSVCLNLQYTWYHEIKRHWLILYLRGPWRVEPIA